MSGYFKLHVALTDSSHNGNGKITAANINEDDLNLQLEDFIERYVKPAVYHVLSEFKAQRAKNP